MRGDRSSDGAIREEKHDGFTTIDLLVVLAILGLIVGVVAMAGALPIGG